jgi:DNA-binding transcriptional LysR family regulator
VQLQQTKDPARAGLIEFSAYFGENNRQDPDLSNYLPTLKQLQYLAALKEHGHFGRAAESCFVTQSTLSAGLRELESLLGVTLVERTRRVVRFTPLGDAIVAKAHQVLRGAEELSDMAKSAGQPLSGDLRMSVIPTIAPFLLPRLLPDLRRNHADLKLYLREETSSDACEALHHGQVDCVLLALPFPCGDSEHEPLFEDRLFVAFPKDDPRELPAYIPPNFIDETRLLLLTDGHCLKACAGRLQPPGTACLGHDDGHLAAHAGADGGQWPRADIAARNGDPRRLAARHAGGSAPAESQERIPPDRAAVAQGFPARGGVSPAGARASRALRGRTGRQARRIARRKRPAAAISLGFINALR